MKRLQHSGFAKQLIIYLLTTLIIIFIVISFLIINSVHTNWIILLLLSEGLIIMCIGIIYIVHHLSAPLTHLTIAIRQMADGDFKIVIPQKKSSAEINELYASFIYMQQKLIDYIEKLKQTTIEQEQRESEMNMARRIQQRFLPHHINLPNSIELAAALYQSKEVSGDLYDFFIINNHLYFTIGDVSGKGTPAALYMVSICKLFRYVSQTHTSTATICNIINKHMCEDTEDDMYATIFMGILDLNTGILTYTNAGHPYPLIIQTSKNIEYIDSYLDVPVGILEDHQFDEYTYQLTQDTSLLFYTDGITDAENPQGQFFGKEKLVEKAKYCKFHTPQESVEAILQQIKQHIDTRHQSDDLTLLLIKYCG